jgi:hypothetical protein
MAKRKGPAVRRGFWSLDNDASVTVGPSPVEGLLHASRLPALEGAYVGAAFLVRSWSLLFRADTLRQSLRMEAL